MIFLIGVLSILAHSFTNEVVIGSRSHVLALQDASIFSTSSSDTSVKKDFVFLIRLDLITWIGDDDCKPDMIIIFLN